MLELNPIHVWNVKDAKKEGKATVIPWEVLIMANFMMDLEIALEDTPKDGEVRSINLGIEAG